MWAWISIHLLYWYNITFCKFTLGQIIILLLCYFMYTVNLFRLVHQPFDPLSVPNSSTLVVLLSCWGSFTTKFTSVLTITFVTRVATLDTNYTRVYPFKRRPLTSIFSVQDWVRLHFSEDWLALPERHDWNDSLTEHMVQVINLSNTSSYCNKGFVLWNTVAVTTIMVW